MRRRTTRGMRSQGEPLVMAWASILAASPCPVRTPVTTSWINTADVTKGWRLPFIWVGPQPPCPDPNTVSTAA